MRTLNYNRKVAKTSRAFMVDVLEHLCRCHKDPTRCGMHRVGTYVPGDITSEELFDLAYWAYTVAAKLEAPDTESHILDGEAYYWSEDWFTDDST